MLRHVRICGSHCERLLFRAPCFFGWHTRRQWRRQLLVAGEEVFDSLALGHEGGGAVGFVYEVVEELVRF